MAAKSKQGWQESPALSRPLNGMHPYPSYTGAPLNGDHQFDQPCMDSSDPNIAQPSNASLKEEQSQPQQVDESREPDGQAPSEPPEERREDDILAKAAVIRSLRTTLSFVDKGPWPEPQRPTDQWAYTLREAKWLAADFAQERRWKHSVAKAVATEAAKFDRSRLKQSPGVFGDEIRQSQGPPVQQAGLPKRGTKRGSRDHLESSKAKGSSSSLRSSCHEDAGNPAPEGYPIAAVFTYNYALAKDALSQHVLRAAEKAAIAKDMAVWKYQRLFEKSLLEAREQALAARKQLTAEIRGRDRTPVLDFEEALGKQPKRRKIRSAYEEASVEPEPSLPIKRLSTFRKTISRPTSGMSEDVRRDLDSGVETSGRREARRKRKKLEYEDDDYEEPPRLRDPKPSRKPPAERTRPGGRNEPRVRSTKKNSMLGGRQSSRHLDPESVLNWTSQDDNMLCCTVHEFGGNWLLVADILSSSMRMSGIRRSALQCKARFFELAAPHFNDGLEMETQLALDKMRINKIVARDVISKSLPIPDPVLTSHQKILHSLCLIQRDKRAKGRAIELDSCKSLAQPHPSVTALTDMALRQNNGRHLNPVQIAESSDHLAQQQAMAQQQAAQVAAAAPPVAPGISGGQAVAQSPPQAPGGPPHAGDMAPGGSPSTHQAHLMQQQAGGMSHQGHPNMGMSRGLGPPGMPQQGFPNAQSQAMPPPNGPPQSRPINVAQLQEMLRTGKMPDGRELNPVQRQSLMNKLAALQRRPGVAQGMPGGMTGRPAGVHGLPFNQASGMRPPLPGVHGMQAGQLGMGSPMANPGGLTMAGQPGLPGQMAAHRGAPSHMQGHMQGSPMGNQGGLAQMQVGAGHMSHAPGGNALPGQLQAQAPGQPAQLQGLGAAGGGMPSMQGQQMGAISAAMPNQLSGQMHGQVGAPMGNHLPTRGPGFPAGYGPQGQMQAGGAGMQGMLGRPGGQRPPLPGRNSATLQQGGADLSGQMGWPHSMAQQRIPELPTGLPMGPPNGMRPDALSHQPHNPLEMANKQQRPHMPLQPGMTHLGSGQQ